MLANPIISLLLFSIDYAVYTAVPYQKGYNIASSSLQGNTVICLSESRPKLFGECEKGLGKTSGLCYSTSETDELNAGLPRTALVSRQKGIWNPGRLD